MKRILRDRRKIAWVIGLCGIAASCGGSTSSSPAEKAASKPAPEAAPLAELDDDALAERYVKWRERLDADPKLATGPQFAELSKELSEIANAADDPHLRANASLLLGSIFEARGDAKTAAAHYRHAAKLVPDDAGPWMALAVASAAADDLPAAVQAQERATKLDPDNLENWLALGELHYRTGDKKAAAQAYAGYEQRRKGIIDGLTKRHPGGDYFIGEPERIGCAEALASAADSGTAAALIYALANDPSPKVRAAVAQAMGAHRLSGYAASIDAALKVETDPDAKDALTWAKAEIVRDPVDVAPGTRPLLPPDDPRRGEVEPAGGGTGSDAPAGPATAGTGDAAVDEGKDEGKAPTNDEDGATGS